MQIKFGQVVADLEQLSHAGNRLEQRANAALRQALAMKELHDFGAPLGLERILVGHRRSSRKDMSVRQAFYRAGGFAVGFPEK